MTEESKLSKARVRASLLKDQWSCASQVLGDRVQRLQSPALTALLQRLEATPRLAWSAVSDFDLLANALHAELGDEGYRAITRQNALAVAQSEVFAGMVTTFRALFGAGPTMLLRAYPSAFSVLYTDFGRMELTLPEGAENTAVMTLTGTPPEHLHRAAIQGLAGSFEALVQAMGARPSVEVDASRVSSGILSFTVRW